MKNIVKEKLDVYCVGSVMKGVKVYQRILNLCKDFPIDPGIHFDRLPRKEEYVWVQKAIKSAH